MITVPITVSNSGSLTHTVDYLQGIVRSLDNKEEYEFIMYKNLEQFNPVEIFFLVVIENVRDPKLGHPLE